MPLHRILLYLIVLVQAFTAQLARNASRFIRLIGVLLWAGTVVLGILYVWSIAIEARSLTEDLPIISGIFWLIELGIGGCIVAYIFNIIYKIIQGEISLDDVGQAIHHTIQPEEIEAGRKIIVGFIILDVVVLITVAVVMASNPGYEFEAWAFQKTHQAMQEVKTLAGEATTVALKREPPKVTTTENIPPERTRPEPARLDITGPTCSFDAEACRDGCSWHPVCLGHRY